jgi:hypothetical protein
VFLIDGPLKLAADARMAAEPHAVTYVDFLTVTLTALCALLAALAIFIAFAAIWGYAGIREEITKAVTDRAEKALVAKLGEYPDSRAVLDLFDEMRAFHEQQKRLSDLLVTGSASKGVARTSKPVQNKAKTPGSIAKNYPGKGV